MKNIRQNIVLFYLSTTLYWIPSTSIPQITFEKSYGGINPEYGFSVQQTQDEGYIIAGRTFSFGAGKEDLYLIKTDSFGDKLWTKTFGGTNSDGGFFVEETSDGGYILSGYTFSFGAVAGDVYLVKTDSLGNTLWTRRYGGTGHEDGMAVHETSDGGYILVGHSQSFGSGGDDVYLIKTNSLGIPLWSRTYGGSDDDVGWSVQETADGGFIVAGCFACSPDTSDIYLIKTDSLGNTDWTRTYGGSASEFSYSVEKTSDGGFIVAGVTSSFGAGGQDVYLVKTNSFGDTLWTKTYGGTNSDAGYFVEEITDGEYILTGYTFSFGAGGVDLYLIKAGALGDTFWTRTHGDSADDVGRTVHRTSDGGYIISGRTNSIGAGEDDFYLIKTDDLGNIHDCGTVSLLAPEDTVFTDSLYVPQARVRNFGNLFKTIDVFVTIGSYADTVSGVNLAPRSETLVAFAPWTVPPSDSTNYTMSVCTEAPNDFNTTNDCRSKNIFAFTPFHDIGVISLDAPGDTVFTDSSVSVRATVKNFGFYNETFDVIATIDGYSDTVQVTGITPGNSFQVSFANWTVPSMDSTLYTMTVCAQLPSDVEPSNNCDSKIIFAYSVVHDGGVITIDSPEDTVFTDSSYSVRATVKNFGETYIYCNVIATIDGYSDTIWVSNLPPQSNTRVVLKPWRVPMNDSTLYSMKVCTYLTNDTDTTNDCAEKSIFAFNPVGIEESMEQEARSTKFALLQNLPNPFNQFTVIRYQIPTTNHLSQVTSDVTLKIYDLTGNLVATLIDEKQEPGLYQIPIRYDQLPSNGVYFIRMKASPNRAGNTPLHTQTRKMILLH